MSTQTKQPGARRRAIIAAASGFALLLGGATYALWTSTDTVKGGEIQAGDMKITAEKTWAEGKAFTAWDVTANRADELTPIVEGSTIMGHSIDLDPSHTDTKWRITPQDTAAFVFKFTAMLVGDNLLADVTVDPSTLVQPVKGQIGDMAYSYAVLDQTGKTLKESAMSSTGQHLATIASSDSDKGGGLEDKVDAVVDPGTHEVSFYLVIMPTFNQLGDVDVTAENSYVKAFADMTGDIKVSLKQVREGGQFPAPAHS